GGIAYSGWWGVNWLQQYAAAEDYPGEGTGSVVVEITAGQRLDEIGQTLFEAAVVSSQRAFAEAANRNPLAVNIQPGFYELPVQMRSEEHTSELQSRENL